MFLFGVKKESNVLVRSCLFQQAFAGTCFQTLTETQKANEMPVWEVVSLEMASRGRTSFPKAGQI